MLPLWLTSGLAQVTCTLSSFASCRLTRVVFVIVDPSRLFHNRHFFLRSNTPSMGIYISCGPTHALYVNFLRCLFNFTCVVSVSILTFVFYRRMTGAEQLIETDADASQGDGEVTGPSSEGFNFEVWAKNSGLSRKTERVLRSEEMTSDRALRLLEASDIRTLDLSLGQRKLLEVGVAELRCENTRTIQPSHQEPADASVATADNALSSEPRGSPSEQPTQLEDVNRLVADLLGTTPKPPATTGRSALLTSVSELAGRAGSSAVTDNVDLSDILGVVRGLGQSDQDTVLTSLPNGVQLLLKNDKNKRKWESLSVSQWCAANCTMIQKLVAHSDTSRLVEYVEYVKRICELAEFYEWPSVLQYDKAFRAQQELNPGRWDADHPHLDRLYLRISQKGPTRANTSAHRSAPDRTGSGGQSNLQSQEPCRLYNVGRCNFNPCRFPHVCNVPGCRKNHPQTDHQYTETAGTKN